VVRTSLLYDSAAIDPLIVHELTHIGQQRKPGFVPAGLLASRELSTGTDISSSVQEAQAEAAEQVFAAQREGWAVNKAASAEPWSGHTEGQTAQTTGIQASTAQAGGQTPDGGLSGTDGWGGLPAPWEPLPDWLTAEIPLDSMVRTSEFQATPASPDSGPAVQFADSNRAGTQGSSRGAGSKEEGGQSSEKGKGHHPDQDLEALARKVYAVIRQRLLEDRRRESR
jgi:hypothetical protein